MNDTINVEFNLEMEIVVFFGVTEGNYNLTSLNFIKFKDKKDVKAKNIDMLY